MKLKLANCDDIIDTDELITMRTETTDLIIVDTSLNAKERIADFWRLNEEIKKANVPILLYDLLK